MKRAKTDAEQEIVSAAEEVVDPTIALAQKAEQLSLDAQEAAAAANSFGDIQHFREAAGLHSAAAEAHREAARACGNSARGIHHLSCAQGHDASSNYLRTKLL